jgi:hypothetical protein
MRESKVRGEFWWGHLGATFNPEIGIIDPIRPALIGITTLKKNLLDTLVNNIIGIFLHRLTRKNHQFTQTPQSIDKILVLKFQIWYDFLSLFSS